MFDWISNAIARRRAAQAAFAADVIETANQVQHDAGDAYRGWWRAQDHLREARGSKDRRFWMAVVAELDGRNPRVEREGPDTATRMWLAELERGKQARRAGR